MTPIRICTSADASEAWRETYRYAYQKASDAAAAGASPDELRRRYLAGFQAFDPISAETVVSIINRAFGDVVGGRPASSPFLTERADP